ncbi:MAG: hypothetical protein HWN66_01125 [Candidatus Helarchaeota archaeon]|nr:hypothetical protein [Candidatus Helarchaeota archaeon]
MNLGDLNSNLTEISNGINYVIGLLLFQVGLLFLKQWFVERKKHLKNATILGYGLYFIFFSLGMFMLFFITSHPPIPTYNIYFIFSIVLRGIGVICLTIVLELKLQKILKTRYLITLTLTVILSVTPFILNFSLFYHVEELINAILLILPMFFIFYFIKNTHGAIRRKLSISLLGFILFGLIINFSTLRVLGLIETSFLYPAFILFPIKLLTIVGISLIFYGFYGYSFFLESQWKENLLELHIIDKERTKCVYHKYFSEERLEHGELFAGGLTGIEKLVKEFTDSQEEIDVITLENKLILLSHGTKIISALIVKKNLQNMRFILKTITSRFEFFFWDYLKFYETYESVLARSEIFKPMEMFIHDLVKF